MATDIKTFLAYELIEMCNEFPSSKITVTSLLDQTGISRQQFYKQFRDINDLIYWIWVNKIWYGMHDGEMVYSPQTVEERCQSYIRSHKRQKRYLKFMQFAYRQTGQNCLRTHAIENSIKREGLHLISS